MRILGELAQWSALAQVAWALRCLFRDVLAYRLEHRQQGLEQEWRLAALHHAQKSQAVEVVKAMSADRREIS